MTRDEAFKIVKPMYGGSTDELLDIWQSLGMLKFTSVEDRAIEALVSIRIGRESAPSIIDALNRAGLKIVEIGAP
jgi:hypothetical protein